MKICVFGADGRTGVEVVRYAHACGFEVMAFVYSDGSSIYFPSGVSVYKGDVMNYESVLGAMRGTEAVISVLGHIKGSDPLMQTKGITNIVRAMKTLGIRRVLSLTGTGVRVKGDTPSVLDRFLNMGVAFVDPDRIHDGTEHVKVLETSGLDFTVVRVLKLSNSEEVGGDINLTDGGPAEFLTSRKKVAKVLVDLVREGTHIAKLPVIS